mmetsp:Transcript_9586/g.19749  ORF Transcript_9586/g.19749 Transcript_9586/m.19749 type:complete len:354 (-) Transcript_9586:131-1192(-)
MASVQLVTDLECWLTAALRAAARAAAGDGKLLRLFSRQAMEVSHSGAMGRHPAAVPKSPIAELDALLGLFPRRDGKPINVKEAIAVLRGGGHQEVAKRLQRRSKARNGAAHTDPTLSADLQRVLNELADLQQHGVASVSGDVIGNADNSGFDRGGYDIDGYDSGGFDSGGYNKSGFDRHGFNSSGFDLSGYDKDGYDIDGFDSEGFDRGGFSRSGFDRRGYNSFGFDLQGYDKDGYDPDGYDSGGVDRGGYDKSGFDRQGYNSCGFDLHGYDKDGHDTAGYDQYGYDVHGFDKGGYDKGGRDEAQRMSAGSDKWREVDRLNAKLCSLDPVRDTKKKHRILRKIQELSSAALLL